MQNCVVCLLLHLQFPNLAAPEIILRPLPARYKASATLGGPEPSAPLFFSGILDTPTWVFHLEAGAAEIFRRSTELSSANVDA